jgi:hypothetical protein
MIPPGWACQRCHKLKNKCSAMGTFYSMFPIIIQLECRPDTSQRSKKSSRPNPERTPDDETTEPKKTAKIKHAEKPARGGSGNQQSVEPSKSSATPAPMQSNQTQHASGSTQPKRASGSTQPKGPSPYVLVPKGPKSMAPLTSVIPKPKNTVFGTPISATNFRSTLAGGGSTSIPKLAPSATGPPAVPPVTSMNNAAVIHAVTPNISSHPTTAATDVSKVINPAPAQGPNFSSIADAGGVARRKNTAPIPDIGDVHSEPPRKKVKREDDFFVDVTRRVSALAMVMGGAKKTLDALRVEIRGVKETLVAMDVDSD